MFNDLFSIDNLEKLDLHGETRDFARIKILEFLKDSHLLKKKYVLIVHGKGNFILKEETHKTLKTNKYVEDYKIYYYNEGCTVVKLKY